MRPFGLAMMLLSSVGLVVAGNAATIPHDDGDAAGAAAPAWLANLMAKLWSPEVELSVLAIDYAPERVGAQGAHLEADPGYTFALVTVRLNNTGTVPAPASTWHFSAELDNGRAFNAAWNMPHHDFDGSPVMPDSNRDGTLAFQIPAGFELTKIVWRGELAWASAGIEPQPADASAP